MLCVAGMAECLRLCGGDCRCRVAHAGKLRSMVVNDLPVGRSVEETLRLVKAFQFTDEHGEVCPANWKPGAATIDTSRARSFFSATYGDSGAAAAAPAPKKSKK